MGPRQSVPTNNPPPAASGAAAPSAGGAPAPKWEPDSASTNCRVCGGALRTFNRHHCRVCGSLVCSGCSTGTKTGVRGYAGAVRVCDRCLHGEAAPANSLNSSPAPAGNRPTGSDGAATAASAGTGQAAKPAAAAKAAGSTVAEPSKVLAAIPTSYGRRNSDLGTGGGGGAFGGSSVAPAQNRHHSSAMANALVAPVARPIPRVNAWEGGSLAGAGFGAASSLRAPGMGAGAASLARSPMMRGPIAIGGAQLGGGSRGQQGSGGGGGAGASLLPPGAMVGGASLRLSSIRPRVAVNAALLSGSVSSSSPNAGGAASNDAAAAALAAAANSYAGSLPTAFFARMTEKYTQQQQAAAQQQQQQQSASQQLQLQQLGGSRVTLSLIQSYVLDSHDQIAATLSSCVGGTAAPNAVASSSEMKTVKNRIASLDNVHLCVHFRGVFRRDHFRTCVQVVLDRHPALHSRLLPQRQLLTLPHGALLSYQFAASSHAALADLVSGAVYTPFNLSTDVSLFRVHVFEVKEQADAGGGDADKRPSRRSEEHVCVFVAHRLVADERSLGIFFDDVRSLYKHANELVVPDKSSQQAGGTAAADGASPQPQQMVVLNEAVINRILPPVFAADFSASLQWDRDLLSTTEGQELRHQIMAAQIGDSCATIAELPTDHGRGSSYAFNTAVYELPLAHGSAAGGAAMLTDDVLELLRMSFMAQSASLSHGLLAAFGALLLRYTGGSGGGGGDGDEEVPIAVRQDMRPFCSAADAVGPFTNFSIFTARGTKPSSSSASQHHDNNNDNSGGGSNNAGDADPAHSNNNNATSFADLLAAARSHCNDLETRCVPFPALLERASLSAPGGHFPLAQIGFFNHMLLSGGSAAQATVALSLGLCEDHRHHSNKHHHRGSPDNGSGSGSPKKGAGSKNGAPPLGALDMGDVLVTTPHLFHETQETVEESVVVDAEEEEQTRLVTKKRRAPVALPRASMFDLSLHVWEDSGSSALRIAFEYNCALLEPASVHRLAESFAELLNDVARRGTQHPVPSYSVLSLKQRHQLLFAFNNNPLSASRDEQRRRRGVQALVEDAAAQYGDRVAITMPEAKQQGAAGGDGLSPVAYCRPSITYAELDRLSNQLARFLRTRFIDAVSPSPAAAGTPVVPAPTAAAAAALPPHRDHVIAVCMPRCTLQFVAVLAILKAGAAYLPLDMSYPADRLDFMLGDSTALCVITSRDVCDGPLGALFVSRGTPAVVVEEVTGSVAAAAAAAAAKKPGGSALPPASAASSSSSLPVAEVLEFSTEPLRLAVDPDWLAYVIYTSGSTGKPKGVEMRHGALTNLVMWQNDYLPPRPEDADQVSLASDGGVRTLQFSPISFDVSFQETFSTWSLGGTMVMVSEHLRLDPRRLVRCLNESRVHRLFLPFVALSHICDMYEETGELPTHLTDIITAGEQLVITRSVINFFNALRKCKEQQMLALQKARGGSSSSNGVFAVEPVLHNHYGPSESHVCSYSVLRGDPSAWMRLPPIGVPISNTQLYVLDDNKQLAPLGVTGELFIGGDCLGRGYLNRPELVARTFIPAAPLNLPSCSSARLYKTGDLVRMLPDGNILYVRRKDFQVKIRGFRIELGEIEARLSQHALVQKCCVEVRAGPSGGSSDKKIVAYLIVSAAGSHGAGASAAPTLTKQELKAHLRAALPDYMVPSVFMFMRTLPLTPSGKINRKGLPAPTAAEIAAEVGGPAVSEVLMRVAIGEGADGAADGNSPAAAAAGEVVPPATATETAVRKIWADVLGMSAPGAEKAISCTTTSFFTIGGHSLSVAKMLARVYSQLGVEIPVSFAFQHPTVAEIAAEADRLAQHMKAGGSGLAMLDAADGSSAGALQANARGAFQPLGEGGIVYVPRNLGGGGVMSGVGHHSSVGSVADSLAPSYEARYPLTLNQQSLVYLAMTLPAEAQAVYNIVMAGELRRTDVVMPAGAAGSAAELSGNMSAAFIDHISDAFGKVLQRFPALRTTFHVDDEEGGTGELYQVVHETQELDFNIIDLPSGSSSLLGVPGQHDDGGSNEHLNEAGMEAGMSYGGSLGIAGGAGGGRSANSSPAFTNNDSFRAGAAARGAAVPTTPDNSGNNGSGDEPFLGQVLADEDTLERMKREARRPFNLKRDSMMRVRLYRKQNAGPFPTSVSAAAAGAAATMPRGNNGNGAPLPPLGGRRAQQQPQPINGDGSRYYLQVVFHHIVTDLWSIVLIVEALQAALSKRPLPAPSPSTATMIDFARYLDVRGRQAAPRMLEQWKGLLRIRERPLPVLDLPTDFPAELPSSDGTGKNKSGSGSGGTLRGGLRSFAFTPELSTALTGIAKASGNTMYTVLLSVVAIALHKFSRQEEVILGTPLANRHVQEFEHTVGYFINPCPIPVEVTPETTLAELLQRCLRTVHSVMDLQEYPFPQLADRIESAAAAAHHHQPQQGGEKGKMFRTMFIYQQPHRLSEELTPFFLYQDGNPLLLTPKPQAAAAAGSATASFLASPHAAQTPLSTTSTAAPGSAKPPASRGGLGLFGGKAPSSTTAPILGGGGGGGIGGGVGGGAGLSTSATGGFNGNLTWYSISVPTHLAMYDLVVQFGEAKGGRVCGCVEYNAELFHPTFIDSFVSVVEAITQQLVTALEQRTAATTKVAAVSTTSPQMADWIITEMNRHPAHTAPTVRAESAASGLSASATTTAAAPAGVPGADARSSSPGAVAASTTTMMLSFGDVYVDLLSKRQASFVFLFRRVAARYGNRTAVDYLFKGHEVSLTFEQLDRLSDALAVKIVAAFHQNNSNSSSSGNSGSASSSAPSLLKGAFVGVALRRGPLLIVAELAVLKAGGAFIPLDPAYPEDRLRHMMSDSSAALILCTPEDARTEKFQAVVAACGAPQQPSSSALSLLEISGIDALQQNQQQQTDDAAAAAQQQQARYGALVASSHEHITGDDRAYAIYTSGSTGKPKGVVLCHRGLVHLGYSIRHAYRMAVQDSRFLLFASPSFDASVLEIFVPLANACAVVMLSPDPIVGDSLARAMGDARVTHAVLPPAVLAGMAEDCFPSPGLRILVTAGEAIPSEVLLRWRSKIHMLNAYGPTENTVASTVCDYDALRVYVADRAGEQLARALEQAAAAGGAVVKAPPIGKCIPNTRCYIVDSNLRPCAVGVPGELVVSGPGVALGYHNLPGKTNECFLPNPFVALATAAAINSHINVGAAPVLALQAPSTAAADAALFGRIYKTGDLVRWSPAFFHAGGGAIEFAGRIDQQVKIRGYRIELGEIESALMRIPGVAEAAVAVKDIPRAGKTLVAYYVSAAQQQQQQQQGSGSASDHSVMLTAAEFKKQLRQSLPDYMVPVVFVPLLKLPLSPSGKIDRNALPTPASVVADERPASAAAGGADGVMKQMPHTPLEITIATLFAEVLGGRSSSSSSSSSSSLVIGVHDNFFEMGGHSLAAMQLVSRLKEHTGVDVPIIKIFDAPTVAALADVVRSAAGDAASTISIRPKALVDEDDTAAGGDASAGEQHQQQSELQLHRRAFTLSYNQEALWFAYLHDKLSSAYNVTFTAALSAPARLDIGAFVVALACIKAVHPMLRLAFSARSGGATQSFSRNCFPTMVQHRWTAEEAADAALQRKRMQDDAHVPHSLEHGVFVVYTYHAAPAAGASPAAEFALTSPAAVATTTQEAHRQRHALDLSAASIGAMTHFTLSFHHIVMDLGSIELVVEQMRDFYNAIASASASSSSSPASTAAGAASSDSKEVDPAIAWLRRLADSIVRAASATKASPGTPAFGAARKSTGASSRDSTQSGAAAAPHVPHHAGGSPLVVGATHAAFLPANFATEVRGKLSGARVKIPLPPVSYIDFAEWQREVFRSQAGEQLAAYWQRHLLGAPTESTVKLDKPRPSNGAPRSLEGGTVVPALPADFSQAVGDGARALGTTVATLLLATTFAWLNRITGQTDLVIGMPVGGRTRQELECIVGDFVNVLPIRVEFPTPAAGSPAGAPGAGSAASPGTAVSVSSSLTTSFSSPLLDPSSPGGGAGSLSSSPNAHQHQQQQQQQQQQTNATFRQVLRLTKTSLIKGLMHQEYPFSLMVEKLCEFRDASKGPLFQVLFVHEKPNNKNAALAPFVVGDAGGAFDFEAESAAAAPAAGQTKLQLLSVESSEKQCQFDIVFAVSEGPGGALSVRMQYASSLLFHETATHLAQQWLAVTLAAIQAPNGPVHSISLLSPAQRELLERKNLATCRPDYEGLKEELCAHEVFERQCKRTPDAVAAFEEHPPRSLTYRQLNACADTLAAALRDAVVLPELARRQRSADEEAERGASAVSCGSSHHGGGDDDHAHSPHDDGGASIVITDPRGASLAPMPPITVAILMRRSPATVLGMLGAAKSGACYVPLDMKAPVDRLLYIVRDSGASAILYHEDTAAVLKAMQQQAAANPSSAFPATLIDVEKLCFAGDAASSSKQDEKQNEAQRIVNFYSPLYIIYTSGSTGNPKGVLVHHGGLVAVASWFADEHKVRPGDVSAQALGAAFDPVNIEIWPYLFQGAAITFMSEETKLAEPQAIVDWLHKHRVSHITFPTVLSARIFADAKFPSDGSFAMRSWSCGGDKFAGTRRALTFAVFNAYGPTEASVLCSQYCVNFEGGVPAAALPAPREPDASRRSVDPPIGTATANTALYVLDEHDRLCPPGVVGELCVGGAQVAVGYHNNPRATAKVFVPDPFAESIAALTTHALRQAAAAPRHCGQQPVLQPRMYRTGDLVRYDGDFNLHFVGRKDFQVKIRGFRIELGEIETQLLQLGDGAVIGAQVVVYEGPKTNGEKRLFAFIIPGKEHRGLFVADNGAAAASAAAAAASAASASASASAADKDGEQAKKARAQYRLQVRRALKARLPEYMVPVLVLLPRYPLTTNGKPDRAALLAQHVPSMDDEAYDDGSSEHGGSGSGAGADDRKPRNEVERVLCELWCDVLGVKAVAPTDNWYSRGGSSLTSTVLISRVKQLFDIVVTLSQFFADATVRGLAKVVADGGRTAVVDNIAETLRKDSTTLLEAGLGLQHRGEADTLVPFDPDEEPTGIFLTGVTGFLGCFLAYELLRETSATVYCLVRAKTEEEGLRRIYENFVRYKLIKQQQSSSAASSTSAAAADVGVTVAEFEQRIVPLIGDLGLPNFGLSEQRFQDVAAVTQHIIHCGAFVNFGYPYSSLKNANVDGTVTALRLATTARLKAMHHISTLSVLPDPDDAASKSRTVTERRLPAEPSPNLHGGYTQSKWVSEQIVWRAFTEHGIPVTVHRPGRITGHSLTGATNNDDFLNLMVKGCLQMRAAPLTLQMPCELTPVDFCATAIVRCSLRHRRAALEGHCFHITNPSAMPWRRFFDIMRAAAGFPEHAVAATASYAEWREQHLLKLTGESHNALLPLVPSFGADFEAEAAPMDYRVERMMADLNDAECVRRVLDSAIDFLSLPQEVQLRAPTRRAAAERTVLICGASSSSSSSAAVVGDRREGDGAGDAAGLRLCYPETSEELVATYARYFVEEKFFPTP